MTDYEQFVPLQDDYVIKDPRYSDDQSEFLIVIQKYGAVPLGSGTTIVPGKYFCFINSYAIFIELNEATNRLLDPNVRQADYNTLLANPNARLFDVWDSKGTLAALPPRMLVDATLYPTFAAWDKAQFKRWDDIFEAISAARHNLPFNVFSRFIQPAANEISLVFTPAYQAPVFDINTLKSVFKTAFLASNMPKYAYDVIGWQEAMNRGLVLTGAHYLHFYFTWMTRDDFTKIWVKLQGTPELMRPWPSSSVAGSINSNTLKIQPGRGGGAITTAKLSHFKALSAIGKRAEYDDQKKVMGASATDVAKVMWDPKTLTGGSPADAEARHTWLHRIAFHFGGLSDVVDLATSQTRENLVYGTGECNTHMIRAENTISALLEADAKIAQDNSRSGTLTTFNQFTGSVDRMDAQGSKNPETIPSWVNTEQYMWLCLGLKYQWTMGPTLSGLNFNVSTVFDPFSRYIPLRVEARLDDALMRHLYEKEITPTTSTIQPPTVQSPVRKVRGIAKALMMVDNSSVVPGSSGYQEPMVLWNAAQVHLPYIRVNNVKVVHPAIKGPPTEDDIPAPSPPYRVIGADALRPHVPKDAPIKAVQLVEIPLQHLALVSTTVPSRTRRSLSPILLPPNDGFITEGDIHLFGQTSLTAKFLKWEGPGPSDVVINPDIPVAVEHAMLVGDFHLSSLIPALQGTAFDAITFRNVGIYHQNYKYDKTKAIGWHFNADLVINESCGVLRDVLTQVLGVNEPFLSVYLYLGTNGAWDKPPSLHSFTLEGVFAAIAVKPVDGVILTRIGVRIFGIRTLKFDPSPRTALEYGFSIFGTMNLDVPSSAVPLTLDYELQEFNGSLSLSANLGKWEHPLGAKGFTLVNTSFSTTFALSSPWKSLVFGVSADFMYKDVRASFQGSYAPGGSFELAAYIFDVNVNIINTLFEWISNDSLSLLDIDMSIGIVRLSIASGKGLSISLDKVTVGDYTSLNADLTINTHSVQIRGDLTSDTIHFGDIELKRAFLQVQLEAKSNGKKTDVIVGGQVAFSGLVFDAAVHLYQSPEPSQKSLEWTVLAALTSGNDSLALSKVVPEVKGTPLDLALTHAVFVVASRDDPSLGNMITSGYSFHQGVQVCAVLSQIEALNSLMRAPVNGLTLSAGWSKVKGFELDVYIPVPTSLNLGKGITTTPFTLAIHTKPSVELVLSAGLNVHVAYSPTPLLFTLSLTIGLEGADAVGQMSGWWVDPLGISPNVKVGPNLALSISIIYAQFVTTGTPSGFAIQGGLMIGETQAQLALSLNEDPMKELLYANVQSLNLTDITAFASDIIGVQIPEPPRDFLSFETVALFISPAGVNIGVVFYPQGFSFRADMILFGKWADVSCVLDRKQISIKGDVDDFVLGPLSVRGTSGPRALIECEIGVEKQHLLIDGVIALFTIETTVHIEVDILPEPKFIFYTQMKFTDLLLFRLEAKLVGNLNFAKLSDVDFMFDALFEQNILDYIHDQVVLLFDKARQAAEEGIDVAQHKVDEAKAQWQAGVDKARAELDAAKKTWDKKNERVTRESNKIIDDYNMQISILKIGITNAQRDYDIAMTSAQNAVDAANRDRAHALQSAQRDVDNAKRDMVNAIYGAQRKVDTAKRDFDAAFASAHSGIERARRDVQSLQNQINDLYGTIHDYEQAHWWQFWKFAAIPGLYVAVGTLEASKEIADAALQVAEALLTSTDFVAKETAFTTAQGALEAAKGTGQAALDLAIGALQAADATSQVPLDAAHATLESTKFGGEYLALEGAKESLELFKKTNDAAFQVATQALVELMQCAELLAYNAAKTGLEIARAATVSLDVAKAGLETAGAAAEDALTIGKWVAEHVTELFDLRVVHLSGSGMIGNKGEMKKPFTAHVEGVVMSQPFTLDGELDLSKTSDFITFIFKDLWKKIKDTM